MEDKKLKIKASTFIIVFLVAVIIFMGVMCFVAYLRKTNNETKAVNNHYSYSLATNNMLYKA